MKHLRAWKKVYESDLESIVVELNEVIEAPAMILLTGEVGTGKTTFTKNFISETLGSTEEQTTSPSYSLVNQVGIIVHADLYRIKNSEEIIHLELPLYLEEKDYFLVEWGRPFLEALRGEIDDSFQIYELIIECNPLQENQKIQSRNYNLHKISSL